MNLLGVALIHLVASSCRQQIETRRGAGRAPSSPASSYAYHTAVNVALFPVLFFFSALFYTDVYSALFVLLAYRNHLARVSSDSNGLLSDIWTIFLGVSTLLMRQTNVFWVAVYMGGLEAVHVIRSLKPPAVEKSTFITLWSVTKFYTWRYSLGDVHDPPLSVCWPDGKFYVSGWLRTTLTYRRLVILRSEYRSRYGLQPDQSAEADMALRECRRDLFSICRVERRCCARYVLLSACQGLL